MFWKVLPSTIKCKDTFDETTNSCWNTLKGRFFLSFIHNQVNFTFTNFPQLTFYDNDLSSFSRRLMIFVPSLTYTSQFLSLKCLWLAPFLEFLFCSNWFYCFFKHSKPCVTLKDAHKCAYGASKLVSY
jgi:hypothetical protein